MADPNRSWSKDSAANTPDSELSDQEIDNMPIGAEDRLVEKVTRVVRPESSPAEDDSLATDSVVEGPGPGMLYEKLLCFTIPLLVVLSVLTLSRNFGGLA